MKHTPRTNKAEANCLSLDSLWDCQPLSDECRKLEKELSQCNSDRNREHDLRVKFQNIREIHLEQINILEVAIKDLYLKAGCFALDVATINRQRTSYKDLKESILRAELLVSNNKYQTVTSSKLPCQNCVTNVGIYHASIR